MSKEVFGVQGSGPKDGRFLTRSVKANGLIFTTLHHGFDPADYDPSIESGTLPEDLETQTAFVLEELGNVLAEAGSGLDRALRATVFVNSDDPDALKRVEASFAAFFEARGLEPPVSTIFRGELVDSGVAADLMATT
jgi:2-iminobutanoate/2-iminopropanoate deaminase